MYETTAGHDYRGKILSIINVGAFPGSDAFLIITKQKSAIIDSGFSFCAEKMLGNLEKELGGRPLDYAILTHSHYDHASGAPYCRARYKDIKIVSSEYAAKIFEKASAISIMRDMNDSAAKYYGWGEFEDSLDTLKTDITVRESDMIDLGDVSLRTIEAPGHTRCSIAFYVPEEKMLISCETMGVRAGPELVSPSFLVGYGISLDFIRRAMALDVDKILIPHFGVIEGAECQKFYDDALRSAEMLKDLIISGHQSGKTQEEIIEQYKAFIYNKDIRRIWPEKAFYLNASYAVPMVIKEILG